GGRERATAGRAVWRTEQARRLRPNGPQVQRAHRSDGLLQIVDALPRQCGLNRAIYQYFGQMPCLLVQHLGLLLDWLAIGTGEDALEVDERGLDALALAGSEPGPRNFLELRRAERLLGRLNDGLGLVARLDQQARR